MNGERRESEIKPGEFLLCSVSSPGIYVQVMKYELGNSSGSIPELDAFMFCILNRHCTI